MTAFLRLPVRRVEAGGPGEPLPARQWPRSIPAVDQVLREGLTLGQLTILVGENGTGKSTIVEAIAAAYGMNPEGGSVNANFSTRATESPLADSIRLIRGAGAPKWGYFLRAETMHSVYSYLEDHPPGHYDEPQFHRMSHGESFVSVLDERFYRPGFYVLDEPESALSFTSSLSLVGSLLGYAQASESWQALIATHSPVVAAIPGARILQLDQAGIHQTTWDELAMVDHYRRFLDTPERYLRHLG